MIDPELHPDRLDFSAIVAERFPRLDAKTEKAAIRIFERQYRKLFTMSKSLREKLDEHLRKTRQGRHFWGLVPPTRADFEMRVKVAANALFRHATDTERIEDEKLRTPEDLHQYLRETHDMVVEEADLMRATELGCPHEKGRISAEKFCDWLNFPAPQVPWWNRPLYDTLKAEGKI